MNTSRIMWVIVVLLIILGGWYWLTRAKSSYSVPAATGTQTTQTAAKQPTGPTPQSDAQNAINIAKMPLVTSVTSPTLGNYLVAQNGHTLYRYTKDTSGVSNCTGSCASNWPPYTISAGQKLTSAANATGKLGTLTRSDGTTQVTYNGKPLYYWHSDVNPGDTSGQNVGGVWFVVAP